MRNDASGGILLTPLCCNCCDLQGFEFETFLLNLSQTYAAIKQWVSSHKDGEWLPPDSFKRRTVKYWVAPSALMAVKVAMCQHLPILVYNGPAKRSDSRKQPDDMPALPSTVFPTHSGVSSKVNSVYMDCADSMQVYERRLLKEDNATLYRVRWYGTRADLSRPAMFLERKVHHVDTASTKERVAVPPSMVPIPLLTGPDSSTWQLLGSAEAKDSNLKPQRLELLLDMQREILSEHQEPVVSVSYTRTAYQESSSNSLRVTIDEQVHMRRESLHGLKARGSAWCDTPAEEECRFPYAILEIKTDSDSADPFKEAALMGNLERLKTAGMLLRMSEFSKFKHAVALLYAGHLAIRASPPWFVMDNSAGGGVRPGTYEELSAEGNREGIKERLGTNEAWVTPEEAGGETLPPPGAPPPPPSPSAMSSDGAPPSCGAASSSQKLREACTQSSSSRLSRRTAQAAGAAHTSEAEAVPEPVPLSFGYYTGMEPGQAMASSDTFDLRPAGAGTSLMEGWTHPMLGTAASNRQLPADPTCRGAALAPPLSMGALRKGRKGSRSQESSSKDTVRVEPKTFFANERTFLSWLSIAVLLLFTGLALMDGSSFQGTLPGAVVRFNPDGVERMEIAEGLAMNASSVRETTRRNETHLSRQIPGLVIVPLALVFMIYALVQYHYRTKKLLSREKMRYDDQWGPLLLVVFLILASLTAFMLLVQNLFN